MTEANIKTAESVLGNLNLLKISQGAEAIIFLADKHPYSIDNKAGAKSIIKYRPRKPYRYPVLDKQIIKQRTVSESKVLFKLFQSSLVELNTQKKRKGVQLLGPSVENYLVYSGGVNCPKLYSLDVVNGLIFMEYVNDTLANGQSSSLKNHLWLLEETFAQTLDENLTVRNSDYIVASKDIEKEVVCLNSKVKDLLIVVGVQLGNMHLFDTIHGDLTSSNIVLKKHKQFQNDNEDALQPAYVPYLIDFGLAYQSGLIEDKAVDLYVLEKALESTHPLFAKQYAEWVLEGYEKSYELKGKRENALKPFKAKHREVYKRLEAVRLRGRKRSMIG